MKVIHSRDNTTFKDLRDLARSPRRQRAERQTLIEGPHLLHAALEHNCFPDLVIVSDAAVTQPEIQALLQMTGSVTQLCLRAGLFDEISELANPPGILARIVIPDEIAAQPQGDCLLLDAIQDAGNVGTLLRTAAAAGIKDAILGPGCAGAWTPRVLRAAQGAHFSLAIREQVDLAAFIRGYGGWTVAAVAHDGTLLYDEDYSEPTAWLVGNEGGGVDAGLLALAQRHVTIPLAAGNESLNVAAATAVCLFEMLRQRRIRRVDAGGTAAN